MSVKLQTESLDKLVLPFQLCKPVCDSASTQVCSPLTGQIGSAAESVRAALFTAINSAGSHGVEKIVEPLFRVLLPM